MKVDELVARCARARESADPINSVREVLENLRGEIPAIEHALNYISGVGGNARQVFYRSPDLTMLKVCFPNGRRTPPHDHGTWAAILLLSGEEKNWLILRTRDTTIGLFQGMFERNSLTFNPGWTRQAEPLEERRSGDSAEP